MSAEVTGWAEETWRQLEFKNERRISRRLTRRLMRLVDSPEFAYCWRYGDGEGGGIWEQLRTLFLSRHPEYVSTPMARVAPKARIPHRIRRAVYERDEYRCQRCGTCVDLTLDHVQPECRGGQTTIENLQTLCRPCNCSKGPRA